MLLHNIVEIKLFLPVVRPDRRVDIQSNILQRAQGSRRLFGTDPQGHIHHRTIP